MKKYQPKLFVYMGYISSIEMGRYTNSLITVNMPSGLQYSEDLPLILEAPFGLTVSHIERTRSDQKTIIDLDITIGKVELLYPVMYNVIGPKAVKEICNALEYTWDGHKRKGSTKKFARLYHDQIL